jgi:hypothetical protein
MTILKFMRVNKAATTSVIKYMKKNSIPHMVNEYRFGENTRYQFIRKNPNEKIFALVRNPWSRAVSSWTYCMLRKGLESCTFKEFLEMPFADMSWSVFNHSLPQAQFLYDENQKIDYLDHLGKVENINETMEWINKNSASNATLPLGHIKKTDHKHYTEYYDKETQELVAEKFKEDIELFNYQFYEETK